MHNRGNKQEHRMHNGHCVAKGKVTVASNTVKLQTQKIEVLFLQDNARPKLYLGVLYRAS